MGAATCNPARTRAARRRVVDFCETPRIRLSNPFRLPILASRTQADSHGTIISSKSPGTRYTEIALVLRKARVWREIIIILSCAGRIIDNVLNLWEGSLDMFFVLGGD